MKNETYTRPTATDIERIMAHARQMRAETLRAGFRAAVHWIGRPNLHLRHA